MSSTRRIIAAAIVVAGMLGASAHAAPPPQPPVPIPTVPVPTPTVPAVPSVPALPPPTIPAVPQAPAAPDPGGPCQVSGDAGDRADDATPLPFLADDKTAADCAGDFGPAGVDTADWYRFEVRPSTASMTLVVQPTFGNAAFSAPLPNGDDVDARLIGPDGTELLPVFAGGRGQPHVFVLPQPAAGLYKLAVLPGPATPTASYTIATALTGP